MNVPNLISKHNSVKIYQNYNIKINFFCKPDVGKSLLLMILVEKYLFIFIESLTIGKYSDYTKSKAVCHHAHLLSIQVTSYIQKTKFSAV